MAKPQKIDLKQGSTDWHLWRSLHLTATDTAKILGKSSFGTPLTVYESKLFGKETEVTDIMRRGTELEPLARKILSDKLGQDFQAACYESADYPFMGASLDAVNPAETEGHEIKTTGPLILENIRQGNIPIEYILQCQKTMLVMGWEGMHLDFFVFDNLNNLIDSEYILIQREENTIREIINGETKFWKENILGQKAPPPTYRDFVQNDNDFENQLALKYREAKLALKEQEKACKQLEEQLKELADGKSVHYRNAGVKVQQISRKGSVDWKFVCDQWKITDQELEKYRKENSTYVKFYFDFDNI